MTTELTVEQDQEVKRILERAAHARQVDSEAWETALRVAVLSTGARALGVVISTTRRRFDGECTGHNESWC